MTGFLEAGGKGADPQPSTPVQPERLRRISPQAEFAKRFCIQIGTLRDWEQHRTEPDQAARAYLKVIAADVGFAEPRSHRDPCETR